MFGEAVVFFDPNLSTEFKYMRKQGMQLHSKMRFIAAQFSALLYNDLWKKNAEHANKMAQMLENKLKEFTGITITQPVETNSIFAIIPEALIKPLQDEYFFYTWNENKHEVRWMTSFDTEVNDIESFTDCIRHFLL
jgi:threonine aldolase